MGVKVGGVETQESPSSAWIRGSMDQGFVVPSGVAGERRGEKPLVKKKNLF